MSAKPIQFAHLHQHTAYSLLDGAARIKDLMKWVKEVTPDKPTVAMTDHGNMHGAVEFYKAAEAEGVKPIIGFEAYVAAGSRWEKKRSNNKLDGGYFHLTLLAKDFQGYQNLCKLNSRGWLEGFYGKPRVDHELLKEYSEGVMALSGCLGAQIPRSLLDLGEDAGEAMLERYLDIYGDNFWIELQNHVPAKTEQMDEKLRDLAEQQTALNPMLRRLADKYGLGMVATNDGHYVKRDDAKAHEALLAIQTKTTLADPNRFRFPCDEFYVKTPEEMQKAIPEKDFPSALANSMTIADLCDVTLPIGSRRVYQMPELPIPEGRTLADQLRIQTYEGLIERYEVITESLFRDYLGVANTDVPDSLEDTLLALAREGEKGRTPKTPEQNFDTYAYPHLKALRAQGSVDEEALIILERAEFELGVIIAMGFPDYFLIVADFINWAKDQKIAVGPGRGSGAGSIVAYALSITNIDPLEFDLLFERFLNPDRISMPDFDIDFSDVRRGEVIDYVREKYGDDKVAHIATFGTMASKAAIKDAARVLEAPYADADTVSKLIPVVFGRSTPIERAMEEVPEIKQAYDTNAKEFMDVAIALEGLTRHASVHAAGVIIAREPVQELAPVFKSGDGPQVCQYDMGSIEDLGFIKMDFLGLRTLSFIEAAVKIIKESRGIELDPDAFPPGDPDTFALLSRGDAAGVFQFEGAGMVDTLRKLKPRRIQDLIAVSALYRPGPMENIPTYIRRHHGVEEVRYEAFPNAEELLSPILKETYGIPVYQEQIMQIAQAVAGYSLGEADLLRRAMGKKKVSEMEKQRQIFIDGAKANDIPKAEASGIFDLLEKFANYGFNKSHSAAYGMLSYQTAYIKTHFPIEFAAALLTVERANSDKVAEYITDTRRAGIEVLPPDINESKGVFTPVDEKTIRFGLYGVKWVSDTVADEVLKIRDRAGHFRNLFDFCKYIDNSILNKRGFESLIKAGAFDRYGDRDVLLYNVSTAMRWGEQQRNATNQGNLFGIEDTMPQLIEPPERLKQLEILKWEKEALGIFVSDHPMNNYPGLSQASSCSIAHLEGWFRQKEAQGELYRGRIKVALAGILQNVVKRTTKSGNMMARFEIADEESSCEILAFSRIYKSISDYLKEDAPAIVIANISSDDGSIKVVADRLVPWNPERQQNLPKITILEFDLETMTPEHLMDLRSYLDEYSGIVPVRLRFNSSQHNGIVTYDTDGIRIDPKKLDVLEETCPWLRAAETIDTDKLLREREEPYDYQVPQNPTTTEVPF